MFTLQLTNYVKEGVALTGEVFITHVADPQILVHFTEDDIIFACEASGDSYSIYDYDEITLRNPQGVPLTSVSRSQVE